MSSSKRVESRQIEVSEMSRGLKILARELDTPVLCLSQLNRQLEYRQDKRPMLADLRESGCLTADSVVTLADGTTETMGALFARDARNVEVLTLDEHLRLVPGTMSHVFESGVKEVFDLRLASGRCVTASANHPFLTIDGWVQVGALAPGARIASTRPADGADPRHDTIPPAVWDYIERKGLMVMGMRAHDLIDRLGADEGCHRVYERGVSRGLMRRIADELPDAYLADLGVSDVLWDEVVAVEPKGKAPVFDATVAGHAQLRRERDRRAQQHRAGRRRRPLHLPRRVLQPGLGSARHGGDHRVEAPQRPDRVDPSRVPRPVHPVRQPGTRITTPAFRRA